MEDPLWQCMDTNKTIGREQLELVIQKKKINEVHSWFHDHFVRCSTVEYLGRCPIVIIQGPTGCGKTSTLRWISNELKIPIKEYSETTDTTAINYDLAKSFNEEERSNLSQAIDRRKAMKFEHFVFNSIRYNTLYPANEHMSSENADEEFDSDDGFVEMFPAPSRPVPPPPVSGVIIHIETPLIFARSQRVLIQSLHRLLKVIREISKHLLRRVAIVFETLEGESETISLPTKVKLSLGIQVFKFNPIIRSNMKKLIESLIKNYKQLILDKETIEQIVSDCDGDTRACINTLQLICNRSSATGDNVVNGSTYGQRPKEVSLFHQPVSKKQKLHHEKVKQIKLNPSLMRDNSRSLGFFHVLGKIFYQKRLYPDPNSIEDRKIVLYKNTDRPYPTENSTEYLANMLDVMPRNLIPWLHQHYYKFCHDYNLEKAALFLENQSIVDTTSLSSTQSSQFYEMHHTLDQLQTHLAIESTVFSLYEDQSHNHKPSHKKTLTDYGYRIIKSSVETASFNSNEFYSFTKPMSMSLPKLVDDYQSLLNCYTTKLVEANFASVDPTKVIVDYAPYLNHLSKNWKQMAKESRLKYNNHHTINQQQHPIFDDSNLMKISKTLVKLDDMSELDFEARHEFLIELIEEVEIKQSKLTHETQGGAVYLDHH